MDRMLPKTVPPVLLKSSYPSRNVDKVKDKVWVRCSEPISQRVDSV